jgi:hypothetical protein
MAEDEREKTDGCVVCRVPLGLARRAAFLWPAGRHGREEEEILLDRGFELRDRLPIEWEFDVRCVQVVVHLNDVRTREDETFES